MKKLKFQDVVKVKYNSTTNQREAYFPTLQVCQGCGGYRGVYHDGGLVEDPELAYQVAMVQFGYSTIRHYDVGPASHKCDCAQRVKELYEIVSKLKIINDSGWKLDERTSIISRGIRDYVRKIKFAKKLTRDELKAFIELSQRTDCPGWTLIGYNWLSENTYSFTTTMDSSD